MKESQSQDFRRLVSQEAAFWYFLLTDAQPLSMADRREFVRWMRRSPENVAELVRVLGLESKLSRRRFVVDELRSQLGGGGTDAVLRNSDELYLSRDFLRDLKKQHSRSKIALIAVGAVALVWGIVSHDVQRLSIAGISFACLILLILREVVVDYRVSKGFFGTTESEARDLIQFIAGKAKGIDFTDSSGRPRPCLLPEPPPPGVHAGTEHAGVLPR
jgi:hypothetical protein